jgi:hypothetical protein
MKSRVWYVVAVALFLIGAAGAGALIWSALSGLDSGMTRIVVPGSSVLALSRPGAYTIFHETNAVIDGRVYASRTIDGLRVSVAEEPGAAAVPVTVPRMSSRYEYGGHTGVSVLAFEIARPGNYRLDARYDGGRTGPQAVLAIGQGFLGRLFGTIFGAIGAMFAGTIAAVAIASVTFFTGRRARRAATAGAG